MINNQKFNTEEECINDYLTGIIKRPDEQLRTYYTMHNGKKLFCIRIEGTKFMDTFKTYKVNSKGQFLKW
jgi:hypothetical protein